MSFVTCPGCGHVISSGARACANCGRAMPGRSVTVDQEELQHTFFPVATHKFVVLSLCTFGLYALYWIFRTWQRVASRSRESMSPFWRTAFSPIWTFSLLPRIQGEMARRHVHPRWSAGLLATLYLVIGLTWRLPDPWWLISLGTFIPLIPVVRSIELFHAGERTRESANREYTGPNIVTMIIGGTVLILAVAGAFGVQPA